MPRCYEPVHEEIPPEPGTEEGAKTCPNPKGVGHEGEGREHRGRNHGKESKGAHRAKRTLEHMSRNEGNCDMSFTFSDIPVVTGLVVFSGGAIVFFAKGVLVFADIRTSIKSALAFMERFETKFDRQQDEVRITHEDFRDCFAKHDTRLGRLELATGLPPVEERRQFVRRGDDVIHHDLRAMRTLPSDER